MDPIITPSKTFDSCKAHIPVHILIQGIRRVYNVGTILIVHIFSLLNIFPVISLYNGSFNAVMLCKYAL